MTTPVNGSASQDPGSTAEAVKQQGSAVASTLKEQASETTHVVQQSGQQVATEAREQLTQLTDQAQREFHRVIEQAQQELGERAAEQTDKVANELRSLANELRALAEGRVNDAPRAVEWVDRAGHQANHYAARLEQRGFVGLVDDMSDFARRRPGAFLVGAIVAGFGTGRLARAAQRASGNRDASDSVVTPHNGPTQGSSSIGSVSAPEVTGGIGVSGSL
jgi:hypothetical protein